MNGIDLVELKELKRVTQYVADDKPGKVKISRDEKGSSMREEKETSMREDMREIVQGFGRSMKQDRPQAAEKTIWERMNPDTRVNEMFGLHHRGIVSQSQVLALVEQMEPGIRQFQHFFHLMDLQIIDGPRMLREAERIIPFCNAEVSAVCYDTLYDKNLITGPQLLQKIGISA